MSAIYAKKIRLYVALLLAGTLLAACMGPTQETKTPRLLYSPASHDVFYPRHTVQPSTQETAALGAFLDESGHNPGGNIALLASDTADELTAKRLLALRDTLHQHGYQDVLVAEDASVPAERIRISASKAGVAAPDCPDWTYAHMANYRNTTLSNHGCAHAVNLSKMVLDPNDLIAGKGDTRPDADRVQGLMEFYRAAPVITTSGTSTGGE